MKLKAFSSVIIFSLFVSFSSFAQPQNNARFISGEVLVQLSNSADVMQLESRFAQYNLQSVQTVSERFHIFLLRFDQ
jgi:hypothetical protein